VVVNCCVCFKRYDARRYEYARQDTHTHTHTHCCTGARPAVRRSVDDGCCTVTFVPTPVIGLSSARCNRAFADRSNLRAHLQTHTTVKKYSCSHCHKIFSRMSDTWTVYGMSSTSATILTKHAYCLCICLLLIVNFQCLFAKISMK